MAAERQAGLEEHIGPWLALEVAFAGRITGADQVASQASLVVGREQHDDGLDYLECAIEYLTGVRRT
jgi:hypothetical protein